MDRLMTKRVKRKRVQSGLEVADVGCGIRTRKKDNPEPQRENDNMRYTHRTM